MWVPAGDKSGHDHLEMKLQEVVSHLTWALAATLKSQEEQEVLLITEPLLYPKSKMILRPFLHINLIFFLLQIARRS